MTQLDPVFASWDRNRNASDNYAWANAQPWRMAVQVAKVAKRLSEDPQSTVDSALLPCYFPPLKSGL